MQNRLVASMGKRFGDTSVLGVRHGSIRSSSSSSSAWALRRYPMETDNGEHYYAAHPNAYYKQKISTEDFVTYKYQAQLPSLPIPDLQETLAKYLKSIRPLCADEFQYARQEALCHDFLCDKGPILQNKLLAYSADKRNWLSEFWDRQSYLDYNDPVVPYVSYFFSHQNVTTSTDFNDPLMKATAIIYIVSHKFVEMLKKEALPAEIVKNARFCMNSFQLMFNNCRIPHTNGDYNDFYSIYENNFVTIAYNGNFYKVYTHTTEEHPQLLPISQIYNQLYCIVNNLSHEIVESTNSGVGFLTSLPRKEWASSYAALMQASPMNINSFLEIHKSQFLLCLDLDTTTITLEEKSRNCWHGNGINRFYDKPLQFFVTRNNESGFLGEHSKMDGTPTLFLNHYLCEQLRALNWNEFIAKAHDKITLENYHPQHLPFLVTPTIAKAITKAKDHFSHEVTQHDLNVWHYNRYGKKFIKSCNLSPDAYIQQIIQLAVYKYLKKQLPTYEAASTRKFFKGRTEAGRCVTSESKEFVTNWHSSKVSIHEKRALLQSAIDAHVQYLKMASNGEGVDRHLFGLQNMLAKDDPVPEIFQDPLFKYSSTWLVSTSQLSSENFDGYGWSQVNDNGFGLAYMINNDWLHINIVNKPALSGLDGKRLHYYLTQAADEIMQVLVEPTKAKL